MWLATELERSGKVERVYYPGLESHPDHAIAKRQMKSSAACCVSISAAATSVPPGFSTA